MNDFTSSPQASGLSFRDMHKLLGYCIDLLGGSITLTYQEVEDLVATEYKTQWYEMEGTRSRVFTSEVIPRVELRDTSASAEHSDAVQFTSRRNQFATGGFIQTIPSGTPMVAGQNGQMIPLPPNDKNYLPAVGDVKVEDSQGNVVGYVKYTSPQPATMTAVSGDKFKPMTPPEEETDLPF